MQNSNIIYLVIFCCTILGIISCSTKSESETFGIELIEVTNALESSKTLNVSALGVESFEYVSLETNENTFKLANPYVISTIGDDKLIVKKHRQMALFNQKTGKYISNIGKYGDDPYSYGIITSTINDRFDQGLVSAWAKGSKEIIEYSIDTRQIVNRINIQNVTLNNDTLLSPTTSRLFDVFFEDKENILAFLPNLYGDSPFRLIRFNEKGVIKKAYPQGQSIKERPRRENLFFGEAIFYKYGETVMFKERYSDTLFVVNDESLSPRYVFNLEDKSPPYQDKNEHLFPNKASYLRSGIPYPYVDRTRYLFIESLIENDDFLIFSIMHMEELSYGFFDKTKGGTYVSKLPNDPINGFYNDIDNFIPFRPTYIDRKNNKIVGFVTAEDVLTWFDENPELANKLPKELSALSRIQPEDNPIVMIGKLKNH